MATQQIDLNAVVQAAARYNIPPAILNALYQQRGSNLGMSEASLTAIGGADNLDPISTLNYSAQLLSQSFGQYGNWESALSNYLTGNPQSYQNPTSTVGGEVYGILGAASVNPGLGLGQMTPSNGARFAMAAAGFGEQMANLLETGGVVSSDHVQRFMAQIDRMGANAGQSLFNGHAASGLQNIYPWGQCTWGALAMAPWLGGVGNMGNASQWIDSARRKNLPVSNAPQVGSVVSFNGNFPGSQGDGHVGVVLSVGANGTFTYASVNWGGLGNTHVGTSTMAYVNGFILAPNPQAAQEAVQRANQLMSGQMPTDTPQTAQHSYAASQVPQTQPPTSPQKSAATYSTATAGLPQHGAGNPKKIAEFAAQLQGAGILPQQFAQNFPLFAGLFRRYMQSNPTLSEFAQAFAQGALTPTQITEYLRQQPHPTYPEITVGQAIDTWNHASLYSVLHTNSTPNMAETSRMAQAGWDHKVIEKYYSDKAAQQQQQPQANPIQQQQPRAMRQF